MFTDGDDALISRDLFPESHPPTDERIEDLQELAAKQETVQTTGPLIDDQS